MPDVLKSAANLPQVKVLPARQTNVVDLLSCQMLLATIGAIHNIEQIWGSHATL
jgi:ribosomal protein L4